MFANMEIKRAAQPRVRDQSSGSLAMGSVAIGDVEGDNDLVLGGVDAYCT
jgi:hypothetical protein